MGQYGPWARDHEGWPDGTEAAQAGTFIASNWGCVAGEGQNSLQLTGLIPAQLRCLKTFVRPKVCLNYLGTS